MKFNDFMNNLIGTGVFLGMIAFCVATVACQPEQSDADARKERREWLKSDTDFSVIAIDGHSFVVAQKMRYDGGISIIHHPSCDCLKTEVKP